MIHRDCCVVCDNPGTSPVHETRMPISFGMTAKNDGTPSSRQIETMRFVRCDRCGTAQLAELVEPHLLYGTRVNHNTNVVGDTWTNHYAELAKAIHRAAPAPRAVLEIGASTDKVLSTLRGYGTYTIVDPSVDERAFARYPSVRCVRSFYEAYEPDETYDLIVSSHFFEHAFAPRDALRRMRRSLSADGVVVMSVPNLEDPNNTFLGMHFEHTFHLTRDNMRAMCARTGLEIRDITPYRKHSVFYTLVPVEEENEEGNAPYRFSATTTTFEALFREQINTMLDRIERFRRMRESRSDEKTAYFVFGCHFRTQAYLHMGLDPNVFECVLDNDPHKHGLLFYGTSLECQPVSVLRTYEAPCCVFVDIGAYSTEVKKQLCDMSSADLRISVV